MASAVASVLAGLAAIRSMHEDITEVAVTAIGDQRWLRKDCSGFRVTRQDVEITK